MTLAANRLPGSRSSTIMQCTPCKTGLIAFVASLALASGVAFSAPKAVKASYSGYMNGMAIGSITEHFEIDGGSYRIVSETKPMGLAAFIQRQPLKFSSRGQVTREGLRPSHFEARRTAADPPSVTADFDWPNAQLVLKHNGKVESLPVTAGAQDRLSIMYQFMFMPIEKMRQVEFAMTNGRKLDRYRYRITPDVEIDTAIGRVKTLHLVKQREPGDTTTEVWLSMQRQLVPVKMLIVEKDGMRFDQVVQSLELRD
jgi:hypothetical protein